MTGAMSEEEILNVFRQVGAIVTDSHIVYTSGKHGALYINKDALYPHTAGTSRVCRAIAQRFIDENVQVVMAPAIGGIVLSQWVAQHLSEINGYEVLAVYAEKTADGGFVIKRGYDKLIMGKNVLVVEDTLTTGGSVKKVIEATRIAGGNVVGLGVLCNRGGITMNDVGDVPKLTALITVNPDVWDEEACPLCQQNAPINVDVGKGREFLAQRHS